MTLALVPGTPTKPTSPRPGSRPGTPGSPRKGAESFAYSRDGSLGHLRIMQQETKRNTRILLIHTINPDPSVISETTSTLLFAKRVAGVKLAAKKKILEQRWK
ncbi:hypothetical protein K435DRAFT_838734 [Dendrothele bispora CBS 962.96]|uniref:Kinesin motor domain-containing protein n=1 Tax=Dendrothele bispora (strain CBS 962.96) TaxID=1314807 RepID=A0A4S8M4U2_DENBC|nr:hypothetical protein K435DRAFT_838734 [Dendrothele bispora CBS 962.96]